MSQASPIQPRAYPDQILGSTREDSQGERVPKQVFEALAAGPKKRLLQQHHDSSLPLLGFITNMRVVPCPDQEGEWDLIGDVTITASDADLSSTLGGWSWSMTVELEGGDSPADIRVYLPFPLYNDEEFVRSLRATDTPVAVGKWVKKQADPSSVALLLIGAVISPIASDLWKEVVRPTLESLHGLLASLLARGVSSDVCLCIEGPRQEIVKLLLTPVRGNEKACFAQEHVREATERAFQILYRDSKVHQRTKNADKVHGTFDESLGRFVLHRIEFDDGDVVELTDG